MIYKKGDTKNHFTIVFILLQLVTIFNFSIELIALDVLVCGFLYSFWRMTKSHTELKNYVGHIENSLHKENLKDGESAKILSNEDGDISRFMELEVKFIEWKKITLAVLNLTLLFLSVVSLYSFYLEKGIGFLFLGIVFSVGLLFFSYILFKFLTTGLKSFKIKREEVMRAANLMELLKIEQSIDRKKIADTQTQSFDINKVMNNIPEEQSIILKSRYDFSLKYAKDKGWNEELSMEQIMEIRNQKGWKNPKIK